MAKHSRTRKRLRSPEEPRILYDEGSENVESAVKKLLSRREALRRQRAAIETEINSIDTALGIIGVSPGWVPWFDESAYLEQTPFRGIGLTEACLKVLADYGGPMDKSQVEYLVAAGGYDFSDTDSINSVEVTLRRLAADGRCRVDKQKGPRGHLYSTIESAKNGQEQANAIADTGATT